MSRIYAGIGARKTPPEVLQVMTALASGWKKKTGN